MMLDLLFATLWQGAIILAVAALIACFIPKRNASTQYAVWFIALLALVGVPLAATFSHVGAQLLRQFEPAATGHALFSWRLIPLRETQTASAGEGSGWLVALWAAGACVQCLRLVVSFVRIARIKRSAVPFGSAFGDVRLSNGIAIPIAAGVLEPRIILPAALVETLSAEDLQRIIAHERAHIRRHDVLANALQRSVEAALYFNPCAWFIGRQVTNAREAACDDLAVRATGDEQPYAMCLARFMGVAQEHAPLATPSAIGSRHALVGRIERLMIAGSSIQITPNYYTIGGTVIVFAAMTLALQAMSPAAAPAPSTAQSLPPSLRALVTAYNGNASCRNPDEDAMVKFQAQPNVPNGTHSGWASVRVTVAPDGKVTKTVVADSSGDPAIRKAALSAAARSTFSPKMVNCKPVAGTYLFRFTVNGQ